MGFEILKTYKEFSNLKEESYQLLEQNARFYNAPIHSTLVLERQDCDYVYYVLSGLVTVYKLNEQGKRKVFFMFGKGKYLNEDLQDELNSIISAETFEDSFLFCIPKKIFYQLMEDDPVFMKHVYASISNKIRRLYRQLNNSEERLDKKIASKLYKLAKDHGVPCEKGIYINMSLSVTHLADLLGSQRESVSRALKILMQEDLIYYERKKFYVRDVKRLSAYFKSRN